MIKHPSAYSIKEPFFLYLAPEFTEKIIHDGADKVLLPLRFQPEVIKQKRSGRTALMSIDINEKDGREYATFRSGAIEINKKFFLPCPNDTVFLCKENHMLFYADEHGCIPDGRCGTRCMEEKGRKFCVLYLNDITKLNGDIREEFLEYEEELKSILGTMMKRNPLMMKKNYARLYLIPYESDVKTLGVACKQIEDGSGFDDKKEYLAIWDSIYRKADVSSWKLNSSNSPWVQGIRFTTDINWDKAWNPYGYLAMKDNI